MPTAYRQYNSTFRITHWLVILSLVFSSFDIALILDLGGVSFRLSQIFQFFIIISGFIFTALSSRNFSTPLAFGWLSIWGFFIIIWTGNTYHLEFSIGQTLFFIFSCALYFSLVQIYTANPTYVKHLFKSYIISFVTVSLFGLFQFFMGIFGFDLLVAQWWIKGIFPRINGFSFEPSYFSTYLMSGWGILVWLIERHAYIFPRYIMFTFFTIITLAIILSSSRMAWAILILYAIFYVVRNIIVTFKRKKIDRSFIIAGIIILALLFTIPFIFRVQINWEQFRFLFFGTGMFGTAAGSSVIRLGTLDQTVALFLDSPVKGYSIGGIASYLSIETGLPPGEATGMNVTLEVLAASGVIGFPFFVLFLWKIFSSCFVKSSNRTLADECLASLGVGLALIFIILQFNQSIMRLYFWNNVFMIGILYQSVRHPLADSNLLKYRPHLGSARPRSSLQI